jgi:hypothetical protein
VGPGQDPHHLVSQSTHQSIMKSNDSLFCSHQ